jgi:hypothetical protein
METPFQVQANIKYKKREKDESMVSWCHSSSFLCMTRWWSSNLQTLSQRWVQRGLWYHTSFAAHVPGLHSSDRKLRVYIHAPNQRNKNNVKKGRFLGGWHGRTDGPRERNSHALTENSSSVPSWKLGRRAGDDSSRWSSTWNWRWYDFFRAFPRARFYEKPYSPRNSEVYDNRPKEVFPPKLLPRRG